MAESYTYEPHGPWERRRGLPWEVCSGCGLIGLKNALTEWAKKKGCNNALHPDWPRVRHQLGGET